MIELDKITLGYGKHLLLENASAEILPGRLTALLGCNGTGKSTLLKAIAGLIRPVSGKIRIRAVDISMLKPGEMSRTVSFVGTERVRIANLKCLDLVALGRAPYTNWIGQTGPGDMDIVMRALEDVGMQDYAGRTMDKMSDGECQRIMIARALAQDTPVMLLDEPTAFLDLPGKFRTASLLKKLALSRGKAVVFSTHDLNIAMREADGILLVSPPDLLSGSCAEMAGQVEKVFGINGFMQ